MPEPAASPDPRGRVRQTVGRTRERTPLEIVWRLREEHRALGLPVLLPDDHVRTCVGRPRPARSRLLLGGLAALVLLAPAVTAQDAEGDVRDVFERYRLAVLAGDGAGALAAVDGRTAAYYGRAVDLALDADSATVAGLSFIDRLMVLSLRHRVSADMLRTFDGPQALAYGVERGWIDRADAARQSLGRVRVAGDSASAVLVLNGAPVPEVAFAFAREGGAWKLDLTSVLDIGSRAMQAMIEQMGETEDGFIALALEVLTGRPVGSGVWQPVGRP